MYFLNHRIGILFRENVQKKSYELRYFFLDQDGSLFYVSSLPRLQKVLRLSTDLGDVRLKLQELGERSFSLARFTVGEPRPYHSDAILPFANRTCIDLRDAKEDKAYLLFGLCDEDTPLLFREIEATRKKTPTDRLRKPAFEEERLKQELKTAHFLAKYQANEQRFKMSNVGRDPDVQFQGDMEASQAHGKCVQTLITEGITFTGQFAQGQKNGVGLLVSETLDSVECEFLDDELVGI